MKRNLCVFLGFLILFIIGCGNEENIEIEGKDEVLVNIYREDVVYYVLTNYTDILIKAKRANVQERKIIIESPISITGNNGNFKKWVVPKIIFLNSRIEIEIPRDNFLYVVSIYDGKNEFYYHFKK